MADNTDPPAVGDPLDPGQTTPASPVPVEVKVERQEERPAPAVSVADEFISRLMKVEENVANITLKNDEREARERRAGSAKHYRAYRAEEADRRLVKAKSSQKSGRYKISRRGA